jgi:hypothetical protein
MRVKKPTIVLHIDPAKKPRVVITEEFLRENEGKILKNCNGGKPKVEFLSEGGVLTFKSLTLADDAFWSIGEYFPELKWSIESPDKSLKKKFTKSANQAMPYDY